MGWMGKLNKLRFLLLTKSLIFDVGTGWFWAILQGVKCWWCWRKGSWGRVDSLKTYVRRLKKCCLFFSEEMRAGRGNHQVGLFRLTINYNGRDVLYAP